MRMPPEELRHRISIQCLPSSSDRVAGGQLLVRRRPDLLLDVDRERHHCGVIAAGPPVAWLYASSSESARGPCGEYVKTTSQRAESSTTRWALDGRHALGGHLMRE